MASFFFRVCHAAAVPVHSYAEAAVQAEMDPADMAAAWADAEADMEEFPAAGVHNHGKCRLDRLLALCLLRSTWFARSRGSSHAVLRPGQDLACISNTIPNSCRKTSRAGDRAILRTCSYACRPAWPICSCDSSRGLFYDILSCPHIS